MSTQTAAQKKAAAAAAKNSSSSSSSSTPTQQQQHNTLNQQQQQRLNAELERERERAIERNSHPVFALLWGDNVHCELWGLSKINETIMAIDSGNGTRTPVTVYVGYLSSGLMTLSNKPNSKGHTKRGAIRPTAFWYHADSGKYGTLGEVTQEESDYVAMYVSGLMKQYIKGLALIKVNPRECKGFNGLRNKEKFESYLKKYYNIQDKKAPMSLAQMAQAESDSKKAVNME